MTTSEKMLFEFNGIPTRFKGRTFENYVPVGVDPRPVCMQALTDKRGIFIDGNTGTGKTHLAVACLHWLIPQTNVSYRFLPTSELMLELKASFSRDGEKGVLDHHRKPTVLVLDDIGAEKVSDWSRQMFYTLIDRRYRDMSITIITSNLSLAKISELIDDRISSRIPEMCEVVHLTGPDKRVTK